MADKDARAGRLTLKHGLRTACVMRGVGVALVIIG